MRGATQAAALSAAVAYRFQSTHPLRGATVLSGPAGCGKHPISIHAPLAGCDVPAARPGCCYADFNPRTPCGVRRTQLGRCPSHCDFNPRTPCGVRPLRTCPTTPTSWISIHAPLAGCDLPSKTIPCWTTYFNPRTPCGVRRNPWAATRQRPHNFNPRTPCGVRHLVARHGDQGGDDFNPRTPCGVRLDNWYFGKPVNQFQSTHPLRGATVFTTMGISTRAFQSTHPLRGATRSLLRWLPASVFQSTHPLRGATLVHPLDVVVDARISIHAPLAGCDRLGAAQGAFGYRISIHAPLAGCDCNPNLLDNWYFDFNPRTPCGVRRRGHLHSPCARHFNPRTPCGVRPARLFGDEKKTDFNPRTPCGVRQQKYTKNLLHFCNNRQ